MRTVYKKRHRGKRCLSAFIICLVAGLLCTLATAGISPDHNAVTTGPVAGKPPEIKVTVDPRVELMSIIFRLAGNPEYGRNRFEAENDVVALSKYSAVEHVPVVCVSSRPH